MRTKTSAAPCGSFFGGPADSFAAGQSCTRSPFIQMTGSRARDLSVAGAPRAVALHTGSR
jgi:hypothetical protein